MPDVNDLIAKIKDKDDRVRCAAWLSAGERGAAAVEPLAAVLRSSLAEERRAARNALTTIVHRAGRPGAPEERRAVETELCRVVAAATESLTADSAQSLAGCSDLLWMLSEIGGDDAVRTIQRIPNLLEKADLRDLRETARCALERIPGEASLRALKEALAAAPEDFKPALAASIRARGVETPGVPDLKLVPTKGTSVQPLAG